ncbi:hypothetical protein DEJ51_31395 [Streptomyces venezuelae]|uniref:Uncharacterized protein n=1 Tax=Streptomyces venezuelae TaxID=54571 RepID=A0A5P2DSQ1_STRVZ|nr:hypothetical protein [Streptomyces venezuelae]QES58096.1 hypothetical protein DEJ51_31395 [Streptomyces venezuelae]
MGGMRDKRQEPGKGREEQRRPQGSGQDPAHPEPGRSTRQPDREGKTRRREEDLPREDGLRDGAA